MFPFIIYLFLVKALDRVSTNIYQMSTLEFYFHFFNEKYFHLFGEYKCFRFKKLSLS